MLKHCILLKVIKKWLQMQLIKSIRLIFDKPVGERNIPC